MASEADFADLEVGERYVEITFVPTGGRLSFARFGGLLSPARPIGPSHFGAHPTWEIEWLARKLAEEAMLRLGSAPPASVRPVPARVPPRAASGSTPETTSEATPGTAPGTAPEAAPEAAPPGEAPTDSKEAAGEPENQDEPPHLRLQRDLGLAIRRRELSLNYQPTYSAASLAVVGQEALLRWTHPLRGPVPPAEFIPLAEASGDIAAIGTWVLDQAVAEAASWSRPWRVAVNMSPAQFRQEDLVAIVRATLDRHRLPANRLELEITEGVLVDDTSRIMAVLRALRQMGVGLALDDFGTGYSNLTYLRMLPLDRIKIDQSFVHDLGTSRQVDAIVRSIIAMGQALELQVTAEGVTTQAQLDFLRANGCTEVQGFLLGRPRPGPLRRRGTGPGVGAASQPHPTPVSSTFA